MVQGFIKSTVYACALMVILLPVVVTASDAGWEERFAEAVMQHPDIQAARAALEAGLAKAKVFESPLYNPELEVELESEGSDTNFRVDVSQTLDWWDRRSVVSQQAESASAGARSQYQQQVQQSYVDGLRALAQYDAARRSFELARSQEVQQRQLLKLIEQRQQAGDLGQVDAELAHLSLMRKIAESAQTNAALIQTEAQLKKVLPGFLAPFIIPDDLWRKIERHAQRKQFDQWAQLHPAVEQAKVQWEGRKNLARQSRLESKAEPALGIGAGRSGNDNVIAITLSMPLNVRNDYSSNIEAANQAVTSAQSEYQAVTKNQLAEMEASYAVMQQYARRHAQWQEMMRGRKMRNEALLDRLWSAGELSTTEYLTMRQQSSEATSSGIELKAGLDLARIDWLFQSGQIQALFNSPTE